VVALRLSKRLSKLLNFTLEATGFEPLVPKRILSRLRPPFDPHDGVRRGADSKQDNAGKLDGSQQVGHGNAED
jgi:hypothetical protein